MLSRGSVRLAPVVLCGILSACGAAGPTASPVASSGNTSAASANAPAAPSASGAAQTSAAPSAAGWTRPLDVKPIGGAGIFKVVSPAPSPGAKVPIFFMGAQFCPYCAAERWALVSALERFGTLSGWGKEHHNDGLDGFRAVPTYDLRPVKYDSPYISFTSKEIYDHNNRPLQQLAPFEKDYVNRFDPDGGWPFMVINGQYAGLGSGFSPGILQGQNFDAVRQQVTSGGQTPGAQAILREAGLITHYICASTGGAPENVCKR